MVYSLMSVETLLIAISGYLAALLVADPISRWLEFFLGSGIVEYPFDHKLSLAGIGICLAVVAAMALVATIGPARMVVRQPVRNAISYE
jgi:ABC-type lipoprotein release transport system permease subunit